MRHFARQRPTDREAITCKSYCAAGIPCVPMRGITVALYARIEPTRFGGRAVDLTLWIPLTVALGLGTLILMWVFIEACDRV